MQLLITLLTILLTCATYNTNTYTTYITYNTIRLPTLRTILMLTLLTLGWFVAILGSLLFCFACIEATEMWRTVFMSHALFVKLILVCFFRDCVAVSIPIAQDLALPRGLVTLFLKWWCFCLLHGFGFSLSSSNSGKCACTVCLTFKLYSVISISYLNILFFHHTNHKLKKEIYIVNPKSQEGTHERLIILAIRQIFIRFAILIS